MYKVQAEVLMSLENNVPFPKPNQQNQSKHARDPNIKNWPLKYNDNFL